MTMQYSRLKFKKHENERIHLEKFIIKAIPVISSIFLLVSLGFNFYLVENHKFSQYWYVLCILDFLYTCHVARITILFLLGSPHAWSLIYYNTIYHQIINFWIKRYIANSKNIIEKKYKILFLHLWFFNEDVYLNTSIPKNYFWGKIIKETDKELYFKEINAELYLLYQRYEEEDFNYFFNKDRDDSEIIKVVKEIYKEYECAGLAMKSLFSTEKTFDVESILDIQDYLLTTTDIKIIKSIFNQVNARIVFNLDTEVIRNIVNNENRLDILLLLKKLINFVKDNNRPLLIMSSIKSYNQNLPYEVDEINSKIKMIDTKMEYLKMKNDFGNDVVKKKINKI
jgi:hypothetical protein